MRHSVSPQLPEQRLRLMEERARAAGQLQPEGN
jgi:hypothetical protein